MDNQEMINKRFDMALVSQRAKSTPPHVIRAIDTCVRAYCLYLAEMYDAKANPDDVIMATVHSVMTILVELAGAVVPPEERSGFIVNQLARCMAAAPEYSKLRIAVENGHDPNPPQAA